MNIYLYMSKIKLSITIAFYQAYHLQAIAK